MSTGVIALVVWLALLFLSVTEGIEKAWLDRLTALHAPLRITPTEHYYNSYYYLVDGVSVRSGYSHKSIEEKSISPISDPYSPEEDMEVPPYWTPPDLDEKGSLKDPVKTAYTILTDIQSRYQGLAFQSYEVSGAMIRLYLKQKKQGITQASYLASIPEKNPKLRSLLIPPQAMTLEPQEVLLPKHFQEAGALIGDTGQIIYNATTPSGLQENLLPIKVAGFYDPGILSVGSRCILTHPSIPHMINTAVGFSPLDKNLGGGLHVWISKLSQTKKLAQEIQSAFEQAGIASYWEITPFYAYDFAKELLQQFQSDKYLFTLIAAAILLVACCNIISLLILLVHDKKREIAILHTLGASKKNIATIFALCGVSLGIISASCGALAAFFTLKHIDVCVGWISHLCGQELFHMAFYGPSLPNELSPSALLFVMITTPILALCAGLFPAVQACHLKPASLLRME